MFDSYDVRICIYIPKYKTEPGTCDIFGVFYVAVMLSYVSDAYDRGRCLPLYGLFFCVPGMRHPVHTV